MPVAPRAALAEVVRAEDHLRLAAAHDGVERRVALDAALGAPQEVEGPEDDVVHAEGDRDGVGQGACDFAARAAGEGALLAARTGGRVIDEEHAPSAKKRRNPASSALVSGATSASPLQ